MIFYGPYKHLWALTVRGRDLVGRGRTPRPSERGVGALVQIETRGREGSRGVMRGRDVPRVLGRWVSKCDIVCFTYLLVVVCCSQFWYVPGRLRPQSLDRPSCSNPFLILNSYGKMPAPLCK